MNDYEHEAHDHDTPVMREEANASREDLGDIKHRKSVTLMSDDETTALREAFRSSMAVSDSRGYGHFAAIHGFPEPGYCEHRNQLFLPWHRAYLYYFERSLQDFVPGVALPWWDWTDQPDLPATFSDETDPAGNPNPLFSAPITAAGGFREPDWPERTRRPETRSPTWLPGGGTPTTTMVDEVLNASNFDDLSFHLENLHNAVHVWVSGQMADQRFAGWDPIFWAHHAMVDRLWAIWQTSHPGDTPRSDHLPKGLNYFKDMTVADTLNVTDLGYDYAAAEVLVPLGG